MFLAWMSTLDDILNEVQKKSFILDVWYEGRVNMYFFAISALQCSTLYEYTPLLLKEVLFKVCRVEKVSPLCTRGMFENQIEELFLCRRTLRPEMVRLRMLHRFSLLREASIRRDR